MTALAARQSHIRNSARADNTATYERQGGWRSIDQIKAAHRLAGGGFFSPGARRFFNGRNLQEVYGGRYFVTSEQFISMHGEKALRQYTIRQAYPTGEIDTVGEFGAYPTARAAKAAARRLCTNTAAS